MFSKFPRALFSNVHLNKGDSNDGRLSQANKGCEIMKSECVLRVDLN